MTCNGRPPGDNRCKQHRQFFDSSWPTLPSPSLASHLSPKAEAPKVLTQVPGFYRYQLGQFEITALYDGALELEGTMGVVFDI